MAERKQRIIIMSNVVFNINKKKNKNYMQKGSLTVEAAICLPIFMMALIMIAYICQGVFVKDKAYSAMTSAVREVSALAADEDENIGSSNINSSVYKYMKESLPGFGINNSSYATGSKIIDVSTKCNVKIPGIGFSKTNLRLNQHVSTRAFTGDEGSKVKKEMVFVTKTGTVYHTHIDCSYINIKLKEVLLKDIDNIRNSQGGKYYPCERCKKNGLEEEEKVYVTNTGTAYHFQATCSSVKREVSVVDRSTLGGMSKCSRCSAMGD